MVSDERYIHRGWNAVDVSRYADGTHEDTEPALKCVEILGSAVATIVLSNVETRAHRLSPPKMVSTRLKGSRLVWSVKAISTLLLLPGASSLSCGVV